MDKLGGIVEVDETFVGGKAKNRHIGKATATAAGGGWRLAKPHGRRRCEAQGQCCCPCRSRTYRRDTLPKALFTKPFRTKLACSLPTNGLAISTSAKEYLHSSVDHAKGEYVVGAIHTNTIEGFWSLIKRGMVGSFHKVSKKYLPLYVAEFQFRYNNRHKFVTSLERR